MNSSSEASAAAARPHEAIPRLSWPLIIGLVGFIGPLLRPLVSMIDPDTFLHLAAGRWMLEHGQLPLRDPFSQSMPGAAWVPHEWLAEIVLAAVYAAAGWAGLLLLTTACFGLALGLFARRLQPHVEPFTLLFMAGLTGAMAETHLLIRPHVLTFPILVAWAGGLTAARDSGRNPPLWLLPLMVLWANLHGGFMFGLALALYLAGEAMVEAGSGPDRLRVLRHWGGFLLLAILAGLATPNGVAGFLQPFRLMAMPVLQSTFVEWKSPDLRGDVLTELWILVPMALAFGLGLKLPAMRLLLLLGLYYETFQSTRHADLLCWVGPLAIAASLGPQLAARIRLDQPSALARWILRRGLPGNRAGLALAGAIIVATGIGLARWPLPDLLKSRPVAALAAARALRLDGPVFNDEGFGGYLIFSGIRPMIDGRIEMYGDDFLGHYIAAELGNRAELVGLLDRYHITWTLLSPGVEAVELLDLLPGWRRVYSDDTAVIHVRTPP